MTEEITAKRFGFSADSPLFHTFILGEIDAKRVKTITKLNNSDKKFILDFQKSRRYNENRNMRRPLPYHHFSDAGVERRPHPAKE